MPNNPITLRKSTTEEKLFGILEGLVGYLSNLIYEYKSRVLITKDELEAIDKYCNEIKLMLTNELNYVSQSFTFTITRDELRQIIIGNEVFDRHAVSSWINYLLAKHYIRQNPTSNRTKNNKRMPNLDTKYELSDIRILVRYNELKTLKTLKTMITTHTPQQTPQQNQTTLTLYECATSEHQAELKGNSSSVNPLKSP